MQHQRNFIIIVKCLTFAAIKIMVSKKSFANVHDFLAYLSILNQLGDIFQEAESYALFE